MGVYRANFAYLLDPGILTIYGDSYKDWESVGNKIFEQRKSTRKYEESLSYAGLGAFVEKPEGSSVTYSDPAQGYYKTWTNVTYSLGFIVTREMAEDDQYGKIKQFPKMLKKSQLYTWEYLQANILNNAFTSGTGADGSYLCVTNHALIKGGTLKNALSTAADLSMTSLEQALIDIGDWTDDAGIPTAAKPKRLIVPSELAWTAAQLLQSEKDPESNYNAINPAKGAFPYVVWHFLTDADAWFIQTDIEPGLFMQVRRKPDFGRDNDFDTENGKWKATFRCVPGWDDPRCIFGTPGA